jgi:biopolymer transport protein ExbD
MAEKRKTFDVWIVENNTVYREVPFSVVTDWVQQGRLLDDDKVRPAGTAQWLGLAQTPELLPYVPKAEPLRIEDRAEALEPVHVDFSWKPRREGGEEDVDMIPLIDVSLVLLVFFMMTAAVGGAASLIDTPKAEYKLLSAEPEMWWIGIAGDAETPPSYSMGKGDSGPGTAYENRDALMNAFRANVAQANGQVSVRIRASQHLPIEVIRDMTAQLEPLKADGKLKAIFGEVSEKTP